MNICIVHGYLLTGTGSNIYVQNVTRQLCLKGHNVHLICQEPHPEALDFVTEVFAADNSTRSLKKQFERGKPKGGAGHCSAYLPDLEGILPVYVYDLYEGFQVKELHLMSKEEIDAYTAKNTWVIEKVLRENNVDLTISNHTVMQPYEVAEARVNIRVGTHVMVPHGSALNFSVKRSQTLVPYAINGVEDARSVVVSQHAKKEYEGFFTQYVADVKEKTVVIPAGVDIEKFRPVTNEQEKQKYLNKVCQNVGGLVRGGRTHQQVIDFWGEVGRRSLLAQVPEIIKETKSLYNYWSPDADITNKLQRLDTENSYIVTYLGKYLWTKGIHLLTAAAPLILQKHPNTYFLIVGFGQFREILELMVYALSSGDQELLRAICFQTQELFPGAGVDHLQFLTEFLDNLDETGKTQDYFKSATGLAEHVIFTGYVDHDNLAQLLPCADLLVATSIFPEAFGMVAAEALGSGVMPVQTHHTGFIDVIDVVKGHFRDTFRGLKQLDLNDQLVPNLTNNITVFLDYFSQMSDDERANIRQRCALLAEENFSWASITERFVALA